MRYAVQKRCMSYSGNACYLIRSNFLEWSKADLAEGSTSAKKPAESQSQLCQGRGLFQNFIDFPDSSNAPVIPIQPYQKRHDVLGDTHPLQSHPVDAAAVTLWRKRGCGSTKLQEEIEGGTPVGFRPESHSWSTIIASVGDDH